MDDDAVEIGDVLLGDRAVEPELLFVELHDLGAGIDAAVLPLDLHLGDERIDRITRDQADEHECQGQCAPDQDEEQAQTAKDIRQRRIESGFPCRVHLLIELVLLDDLGFS